MASDIRRPPTGIVGTRRDRFVPTAFAAHLLRCAHALAILWARKVANNPARLGEAPRTCFKVPMTINLDKSALREAAKRARERAHATHGTVAAERLAGHGIAFAAPNSGAAVSGFLPIKNEIDPRPLMACLNQLGHPTALPVMEAKGKPLIFRRWSPGDKLNEVQWGILEPSVTAPALNPDILLVPLLAFDDAGYRIGYGGGFYDRSIEKLRALKAITTIGVAFDEQRVDAIPREPHDEILDWILTPSGPQKCTG